MDYYKKKFMLAQSDQKDNFIDQVERWLAHEKGICHRGFTTILIYNNQILLQQRKHPAFDGFYDMTFSSHPIYIDNKLQSMEEAIFNTLKREWNLEKNDLKGNLQFLDKFYYFARDQKSIYFEHEVDYLYLAQINKLPKVNKDYAYGFELIDIKPISNLESRISNFPLCPWVDEIKMSKFF